MALTGPSKKTFYRTSGALEAFGRFPGLVIFNAAIVKVNKMPLKRALGL
jgi:hypothetical protein